MAFGSVYYYGGAGSGGKAKISFSHPGIGDVVAITPRYQIGSGLYFRRNSRPRLGAGFGSYLINFFKPLFKRGLHSVVDVASKVASDAIEGENIKDSLKKHTLDKVSSVLENVGQSQSPKVEISSPLSSDLISKGRIATKARKRKVVSSKRKKSSVTGSGIKTKRKSTVKPHSKKPTKRIKLEKYPALRLM